MSSRLQQRSVVTVGERELVVESEVLFEPEPLIVSRVLHGDRILKKRHMPVPPAAFEDFERVGEEALAPSLHGSHLRLVRRLLGAPDPQRMSETRPAPAGVVSTMVLANGGEVVTQAGEDHVPGGWLRVAYVVAAVCDGIGQALELGSFERAVVRGAGVGALLVRESGQTGVSFLDPDKVDDRSLEGLEIHLKEAVCAAE